jgi:uncharacterized membrane-anchored protein
MRKLDWRAVVFVLVCLGQLAVPASMVWRSEQILTEGALFRFRTAPVDPADLVRGRYVALGFLTSEGRPLDERAYVGGETVHALLEVDTEGFARIAGLLHDPPESGAYLTVEVEQASAATVRFRFPLDRFYLPEEKAPAAERAYREARGRGNWAEIRVLAGRGIIDDLVIDGKPAGQYVE